MINTETDAFIITISNSTEDINESDVQYAIDRLQERNKGKTYKEFSYRLFVPSGKGNAASRIAESFKDRGYPINGVEENANPNYLESWLKMIMSQ